ncbi:proline-rich protein HaeIII subfamily 1-like [Enhydra lutris kenyoni]|uniref:Proline-rich protein HaeIII subfamily 1-like n=1 Tax=Enhydra lutris kenyoni TaxID=391180 RepID=A0A2Y9JVS4_ENHLU|nr:proline-rich protein HaeIII subfamily 1-like [Enhydra lutris kenyoni]
MGRVTPGGKKPSPLWGPERQPSARLCVSPPPPPPPQMLSLHTGVGSRSETAPGHSPAPPLRPAPPFGALQPRRISQGSGDCREETGGGEGEVPRGAVCRARPSLLGVPARNHEWEPREASTCAAGAKGRRLHFPPRPLGVTAATRPRGSGAVRRRGRGSRGTRAPRPRRPPGPARPSPLRPREAWLRRSGLPPRLASGGPPRSPPTGVKNNLTPCPATNGPTAVAPREPPSLGTGDRSAYSAAPERAPWRSGPDLPRARSP